MKEFIQSIESVRFLEVLNDLINRQIVKSDAEFSRKIDYSPQSLSHIRNGKRDVTLDVIGKMCAIYKINPSYIFTGEGDKVLSSAGPNSAPMLQDELHVFMRELMAQNDSLRKVITLQSNSAEVNNKYIKVLEQKISELEDKIKSQRLKKVKGHAQ